MKRISAIAISLLLIIGLTAEAQAVLSGVSKCNVFQGPTDDPTTFIVPVIVLFNPNAAGVQRITRFRIFNELGASLLDQSFPPRQLYGERTWINLLRRSSHWFC